MNPRVSVVVVNYRRPDDTVACLRAFDDVDWPADRLELVVVDNASGDGSAGAIRAGAPGATVIESEVNTGFAGGCNRGARSCSGQYLGFLNNDARPAPGWIAAAVDVLERDPGIGAVASKVLDWEGRVVDYVDGSLAWFGMGYKREVGRTDSVDYDQAHDVLFATGAAMFVRAGLYRRLGGFDPRYFMFYEDVDLGWRMNLLGSRVRYVPTSVAYHRHHVSMQGYGTWREHALLERNALFTIYKNYGDETLAAALPAALLLSVRRAVSRGGDDLTPLDLAEGGRDDEEPTLEVSKETLTSTFAIDSFLEELPGLREERRRIQQSRRRTDAELLPLFRRVIEPAYSDARYLAGHEAVVDAFGIQDIFRSRHRIAIVTSEPVTAAMAGPAIRAWSIAAALSLEHDVELATLGASTLEHDRFRCRSIGERDLRALEQWCDVLLFQGMVMTPFPWLARSRKVVVADLYDPFHLAQLEQAGEGPPRERQESVAACVTELNAQLARGDFFLCASEKQRMLWLGHLAGVGRVNPDTYDSDPALRSLLAVVPFGLSDTPPVRTRAAIKGVFPGIGTTDKVVLWGGGIYDWLDPLTLLRAVDRVRHEVPEIRLVFLGLLHPNPAVPEMRMAAAARELSDALGLTGSHVFFNERWVDYHDRQNYLLDADVGVSTHLDHIETSFSFRTRLLDCIWAWLPIVATAGDTLSELVDARGLGLTVPPGDEGALEEALLRLLLDDARAARCRANLAAMAPELSWDRVLRPLREFCRTPRRAADLEESLGEPELSRSFAPVARYRPTLSEDFALARTYLRDGGAVEVLRRAGGRLWAAGRQPR